MRCWMLCLLLCLTTINAAVHDHRDCNLICSVNATLHDHHLRAHCGCEGNHHHKVHTHDLPSTDAPTRSTLSMCDYLCSIQQGGAACDCSSPVLPGR